MTPAPESESGDWRSLLDLADRLSAARDFSGAQAAYQKALQHEDSRDVANRKILHNLLAWGNHDLDNQDFNFAYSRFLAAKIRISSLPSMADELPTVEAKLAECESLRRHFTLSLERKRESDDDGLSLSLEKVRDEKGRELPFYLSPARKMKESPILIFFHGWISADRPGSWANNPNWTVVVPQDRYGSNRLGCWWLGENGDYFMFDLLDRMMSRVHEVIGGTPDLYTFGGSMGGSAP